MTLRRDQQGFTLLEVLLVVSILALLAGIIILAINPTKQLGVARDAKRSADVNTIINAVYQYEIDNNGAVPGTITATVKEICYDATACTGGIDLWTTLVSTTAKYLAAMPCDPAVSCAAGVSTKYTVVQDATTKRITVAAINHDGTPIITVTR